MPKTRRPNGTGSIAQLKDGRFCVTFTPPGGKRIFRYRRNRMDAETVLARLLDQYGVLPPPTVDFLLLPGGDAPLFREWAVYWLSAQESRLRHSTLSTYQRQMGRVVSVLGSAPLDSLTPLALTTFLAELHKGGIGGRQLQQTYTVLRTCLESAVKLDVIPANPMRRVDKPRHDTVIRDYWTVGQTIRFLDTALASPRRFAPLLALIAATGLRVSEALGLEWEDVNLDAPSLSVKRALVWHGSEYRINTPKTKAGRRSLSLPSQALAALTKWRDAMEEDRDTASGPIFRGPTGEPPANGNLRRLLLDLCRDASVPSINIHGLRHVAATMALKATKDIHAVQRRLGHANVTITMATYAYALEEDAAIADAIDRMLDATPEPEPPKAMRGRGKKRDSAK